MNRILKRAKYQFVSLKETFSFPQHALLMFVSQTQQRKKRCSLLKFHGFNKSFQGDLMGPNRKE
jgi:hypothetical protein